MCRTIGEVSNASNLPVIVDADTGYGEVECLARTVVEYERSGAAGMHNTAAEINAIVCGSTLLFYGRTLAPF